MKILVTGGAGYIGSVLVPMLLFDGHAVVVIDNFRYGQTPLLDVCHWSELEIVRGDAREVNLISRHIGKVDVVIPLACVTGAPGCDRDRIAARTTNVDAIKALVVTASSQQPVLFPTTNSGYGVGQSDELCTEERPLAPVSLYGQLKVEAERILRDAQPNAIIFRLATAFGISPRMRLDLLVNDFVYRAVQDRFVILYEGHFIRNYIHVRDVARVFLHALSNLDTMAGQVYNVGRDDANCSKLELCQRIQQRLPQFVFRSEAVGRDPDQRNYRVSSAKVCATGFEPQYSLDDGILELIKGYQVVCRGQFTNVA